VSDRERARAGTSRLGEEHHRSIGLFAKLWSTDRGLTLLLAVLLLHLFVLFPLSEYLPESRLVLDVVFSLILISGATAVAQRWAAWLIGAFAVASLLVQWTWQITGERALLPWVTASSLVYCALLAGVVFAQIARAQEVTSHSIQGAIAGFLLLGLAWAFAYQLVSLFDPSAVTVRHSAQIRGNDALTAEFVYFSFVTLTTVGYGDITPVDPIARALVMLEALTGQLFPAVLLARLVSLEIQNRPHKR
jgi:Ion channel